MIEAPATLTATQKQAALDQVLNSQTFARSDKLKSFLKFVCEMEIAGRGAEINEYLIGVEALGRPADYSPSDDSAVRNRAYALRQKLLEFYTQEQPAACLRIELPKGAYCPLFVVAEAAATPNEIATEVSTSPATNENRSPAAASRQRNLGLGFLAGMLLMAAAASLLYFSLGARTQTSPVAPVLREVWGSLLAPDANILVCLATPMHLVVRSYPSPPPANPGLMKAPAWLYDYYQRQHHLQAEEKLHLLPTTNSPYWGDAAGALTVTNLLTKAGGGYQLLPERVAPVTSMRGRNVILFGSPQYSDAVKHLMQPCAFVPGYDPTTREVVIFNRQPQANEPHSWMVKRDEQQRAIEVYGLITSLPSEGDNNHRTVIISGLNSAGTQAAAEFFASPQHLQALQEKLQTEGHRRFPDAWQVLIKTTSDATLPLTCSYVTHRVLQR
jgi:hypothetical protein